MKRVPLKRKPTKLKKSPLKAKKPTDEQKQQRKENSEKMWDLFNRHWKQKMKIDTLSDTPIWECESCSCSIGWKLEHNKSLYHHHAMPKRIYKDYQYEIEGLMLVCWQCHSDIENGNIRPRAQEIIKQKQQQYEIWKKSNSLNDQ